VESKELDKTALTLKELFLNQETSLATTSK